MIHQTSTIPKETLHQFQPLLTFLTRAMNPLKPMKFINSKCPFHFTQGFYFFRRQLDIKDFQVFFDAMPWGFFGIHHQVFPRSPTSITKNTCQHDRSSTFFGDLKLFGGKDLGSPQNTWMMPFGNGHSHSSHLESSRRAA